VRIQQIDDGVGIDIHRPRVDADRTVDLQKSLAGGDGFWQSRTGIGFIEQNLSLEIRALDDIAIGDADCPHAGPAKLLGDRASQSPASDQQHRRRPKPFLTGVANLRQPRLADIAGFEEFWVVAHAGPLDEHSPVGSDGESRL